MSKITIYHNPKCSKSRQTLELLRQKGVELHIVEYLKTPISLDELKVLFQALNGPATSMIRPKEAEYSEVGLDSESTDESILNAIVKFPKLLERPIVLKGNRAVIGRPPENVLDLL